MSEIDEELEQEEEEKSGGWLTTWADMMSVLLTFFIVLQAFSTISEKKFFEAVSSIQRAFTIPLPIRSPGQSQYQAQASTDAQELEKMIADEDIDGISVEDYGDRVVLTVETGMLFDVGEADLTPAGLGVMAGVFDALSTSDLQGKIRVEGHTCDLQLGPSSDFGNNWWLSSARAVTVLEALQDRGLPPERLSGAGYGEFRPRVPNTSEENRQKNRRVEFVIEKRQRLTD